MSGTSTDLPFTMNGYEAILRVASDHGYSVGQVGLWDQLLRTDPALLLRHDVDYSLEFALSMAEWEAARDISSSYFVLPHGDFYNVLDRRGRSIVRAIAAMGHEIGMHWDGTLYPEALDRFERAFLRDLDHLSDVIEAPIRSVSQHQPTMNKLVDIGRLVPVDAYSASIRESFEYISDSCMSWRGVTPSELLQSRRNVQFLAHPIWWVADGDDTRAKLEDLGRMMSRVAAGLVDEYDHVIQHSIRNREAHDAKVASHWSGTTEHAPRSAGSSTTSE